MFSGFLDDEKGLQAPSGEANNIRTTNRQAWVGTLRLKRVGDHIVSNRRGSDRLGGGHCIAPSSLELGYVLLMLTF